MVLHCPSFSAAPWALPLVLAISACSSSTPTVSTTEFPATPLVTLVSKGGALSVAVRTAPDQPPLSGPAVAQLTVTDATTGAPVTGLVVSVVPWMPAMGHGQQATVAAAETDAGTGVYVVTNIDLVMPGEWVLETSFTGPVTDSVSPTFNVQ